MSGLDGAWAEALAACDAKGALLYELHRRWEPGVADGWYAMAIKDGWFWRQAGDTPEAALNALTADVRGDGGRSSEVRLSAPVANPDTGS